MTLEDALKIGGLSVTAVALTSGTYQYWKAQRWRRAEFVAQEIKAMKADRLVQAAMLMLDWDGRKIELSPEELDPQMRWVVVTQELVVATLLREGASRYLPPPAMV